LLAKINHLLSAATFLTSLPPKLTLFPVLLYIPSPSNSSFYLVRCSFLILNLIFAAAFPLIFRDLKQNTFTSQLQVSSNQRHPHIQLTSSFDHH